jgi:hypothetical protein
MNTTTKNAIAGKIAEVFSAAKLTEIVCSGWDRPEGVAFAGGVGDRENEDDQPGSCADVPGLGNHAFYCAQAVEGVRLLAASFGDCEAEPIATLLVAGDFTAALKALVSEGFTAEANEISLEEDGDDRFGDGNSGTITRIRLNDQVVLIPGSQKLGR